MLSNETLAHFRRDLRRAGIGQPQGAADAMPRNAIDEEPSPGITRNALRILARRLSPAAWRALQRALLDEGAESDRAEDDFEASYLKPDHRGRYGHLDEPAGQERDDGPPAMDSARRRRARSGFDALFPSASPIAIA